MWKPRYVIAVPDLERSAAFYRDVLGFEVRKIEDPGWRFFVRDGCFIMAGECRDALPAAELGDHSYFAYVEVDDIDAFHEGLIAKQAQMLKPLRNEPWGMREFGIRTVDGHRIMFGSMMNTADVRLRGAAPVFVVQDVLRSVEHYRDVLGFQTEFLYGEPTSYAGVERGNVLIHLQAARQSRKQPGQAAINVFVSDVDALYEELKARGARLMNAPKDYPYGMRDFNVLDLDGNEICFGTQVGV
jgi:uncharacterized glyoxalase superfamily protein PhnB